MSMTAACDDCGKVYVCPDASAGKRARCKACGNVFVVAACPPAGRQTVLAAVPDPAPRRQFSVDQLIVLASAGLAGVFLAATAVTWAAPSAAVVVFPGIAAAYFVGGFGHLVARAVRTSGRLRLPWADILLIGGQIALRAFVPVPIFVYRRDMFGRVDAEAASNVAWLAIRAGFIALLGVGLFALPLATSGADRYAVYHRWSAPGRRPGPDTFADPGERTLSQTRRNMDRIQQGFRLYTVRHHAPPESLDVLDLDRDYSRPLVSPFDPSARDEGYAYLPQNVQPGEWHAYLYDAAELRQTGSTHAVSKHDGERIVTADELAEWTGTSIPAR